MNNRPELHDKIQQVAAKIIDLNAGFAANTGLSAINKHVLQKYVLDLYEHVLALETGSFETQPIIAKEEKTAPKPEPVAPVITPAPPVAEKKPEPPVVAEQPVIVAEPTPVFEKIVNEPVVTPVEETIIPPVVQEIVSPAPVEKPAAPMFVPEKPYTAPEKPKETPLQEKIVHAEKKDLATMLHHTPIHDLKKAISISKKFEFINNLFKGDHEMYTKAIHHLNSVANGNEAKSHLNAKLKPEYGWAEDNKLYIELAELVERRYL